jgi:hypothetical protein
MPLGYSGSFSEGTVIKSILKRKTGIVKEYLIWVVKKRPRSSITGLVGCVVVREKIKASTPAFSLLE